MLWYMKRQLRLKLTRLEISMNLIEFFTVLYSYRYGNNMNLFGSSPNNAVNLWKVKSFNLSNKENLQDTPKWKFTKFIIFSRLLNQDDLEQNI